MHEQIDYLKNKMKPIIYFHKIMEIWWTMGIIYSIIAIGNSYNPLIILCFFILFLIQYICLWSNLKQIIELDRGIKALYKIAQFS